jgi:hypothetical protein
VARVDGTHGVVRSALLVALNRAAYDVNDIGARHNISNRSKGRELTQRVASKGGIRLDKAF